MNCSNYKLQKLCNSVADQFSAILRQIMSLALLPKKLIADGVKLLRVNVSALIHPGLSETVTKKFNKLLDYIDSYWLLQWPLKQISFYKKVQRPNNHLESYHRGLNNLFGKNPTPLKFLRNNFLIKSLLLTHTYILS